MESVSAEAFSSVDGNDRQAPCYMPVLAASYFHSLFADRTVMIFSCELPFLIVSCNDVLYSTQFDLSSEVRPVASVQVDIVLNILAAPASTLSSHICSGRVKSD